MIKMTIHQVADNGRKMLGPCEEGGGEQVGLCNHLMIKLPKYDDDDDNPEDDDIDNPDDDDDD